MSVFVITLGDIVAIAAIVICIIVFLIVVSKDAFKMARCKHDGGVNETGSCDAICRKCGKNLGFIGSLPK